MPTLLTRRLLLISGLGCASQLPAQTPAPAAPASGVIGQVGGQPVRADQIKGGTPQQRGRSAMALIVNPALLAYLELHRREWAPTQADVEHYLKIDRERLACGAFEPLGGTPEQEQEFARLMTGQLKMQRFIHRRHGGGRVLFQQSGTEAYDATRRLLLDLERQGAFAITDPELREQALGYWLKDPAMGLMADPGPQAFTPEQAFNPCPKGPR